MCTKLNLKIVSTIFLLIFVVSMVVSQNIPDFGIIPKPEIVQWNGKYSEIHNISRGSITFSQYEENIFEEFFAKAEKNS